MAGVTVKEVRDLLESFAQLYSHAGATKESEALRKLSSALRPADSLQFSLVMNRAMRMPKRRGTPPMRVVSR